MRILLVEDDKNFGYVLKGELADPGCEIDLAQDGVEGALKFVDGNYDFVLLDIMMPKLDGINTLRIIKKLNPRVPGITHSGNAGSGEMAESVKAGEIWCLTKPFENCQFNEKIRKYHSRHGEA